jgi:hypothetical protein
MWSVRCIVQEGRKSVRRTWSFKDGRLAAGKARSESAKAGRVNCCYRKVGEKGFRCFKDGSRWRGRG